MALNILAPTPTVEVDMLHLKAYLFGSRSMVNKPSFEAGFDPTAVIGPYITPYTDYDYAVQDTEDNRRYLIARGYRYTSKENWYDADWVSTGLFHKELGNGLEVDVILREKHLFFTQVWDSIDPYFYYTNLWKRGVLSQHGGPDVIKPMIKHTMQQLYVTAAIMKNIPVSFIAPNSTTKQSNLLE